MIKTDSEKKNIKVATFESKGGNQGSNQNNSVATPGNSLNNKDLEKNPEWLSVSEGSNLLGISKQAVKKNCKNEKYVTKWHNGNGGKQYRILLSSLPKEAQIKYWDLKGIEFKNTPAEEVLDDDDAVRIAYENAAVYNRKNFDKYRAAHEFLKGLKGQELKMQILVWNELHPEYKTSYGSYQKVMQKVKQHGWCAVLGSYGKKAGRSKIEDHHFEHFKKMYLDEERQTAESCWTATLGYARLLDNDLKVEEFPSVSSFVRRLENEIPKDVVDLKRRGYAYWNKYWNNYVIRDYAGIQPGEVWVSDHRQIDQAVVDDVVIRKIIQSLKDWFEKNQHAFYSDGRKNKKPVYPWLTVWRDFLTGKWLGWYIHINDPNTDDILHAFKIAAEKFGVPKKIIIDNGKDYRSKDFAGGRPKNFKLNVDEVKVRSLCSMLHIDVTFTIPYNAQSKPIERDFKIYKEWLDKKFPGYRGGNVVERPEKLLGEIKAGKIINFGDYIPIMNFFIEEILHKYKSQGKVLQGRSRDEAWNQELNNLKNEGIPHVLRRVSDDDLKLFCMRMSNDQPITRNGICLSQKHQLYYWSDWMMGRKGEYVYMRRDNKKYQIAYVFSSKDDSYVGKAVLKPYAAANATTDLEKEQVGALIREKNTNLQIAKAIGESDFQLTAEEELRHHALGIKALNGDEANDKPTPTPKEAQVYIKTKLSEANAKMRKQKTGTDDVDYENIQPLSTNEDEVEDWI